jgi:hypothetical protein
MPALIDLTGQRFGTLVVLGREGRGKNGAARWRTRCDCGTETVSQASNLRSGGAQSCGCARATGLRARNTTHGMSDQRPYKVWANMIARCTDPKHTRWPYYGARGIGVCDEWRTSFEAFWRDMGPSYHPGLSIDRIDNDGDYEPGNCRWATAKEQRANQRPKKG